MDEIKNCIATLIKAQVSNIHDYDNLLVGALWQHLYDYCRVGDLCSRTKEVAEIIAETIKERI